MLSATNTVLQSPRINSKPFTRALEDTMLAMSDDSDWMAEVDAARNAIADATDAADIDIALMRLAATGLLSR